MPNLEVSLDNPVIAVTKELPTDFPFQQDMNAGNPIGVGWTQSTVGDGVRSDAYRSFVNPFLSRSNLVVISNAQATKIQQTGTQSGLPIMRGVEFAKDANCKYRRLH